MYDSNGKKWTVQVSRAGEVITLHPRHIVLATGMNGAPKQLVIPGADKFEGVIYHSDVHRDTRTRCGGKNIVIIGTVR